MDIWEQLYQAAAEQYRPGEISPFLYAHHVVCAIQAADGKIYTGFCIESACGVLDLCAERVAALNMYLQSGQTRILRLLVCQGEPPKQGNWLPCGACREFLMQLSVLNRDTELLVDYATRRTQRLEELLPGWWGWPRVQENPIP